MVAETGSPPQRGRQGDLVFRVINIVGRDSQSQWIISGVGGERGIEWDKFVKD